MSQFRPQLQSENANNSIPVPNLLPNKQHINATFYPVEDFKDFSLEELFHYDFSTDEEEPSVESCFSSNKRRRCSTLPQMKSFDENQDYRPYLNQAGLFLSGAYHGMSSGIETSFTSNRCRHKNIQELSSKDDSIDDRRRCFRSYQTRSWAEKFEELCEYRKRTGNCLVTHTYKESHSLTKWVTRQRYQYKLMKEGKVSAMTPERVKMLEEIGFVWDFQGATWDGRFSELQEFYATHSHCNVPAKYTAHSQLAKWVKNQRHQYNLYKMGKSSYMTPQRIFKLESLNFE